MRKNVKCTKLDARSESRVSYDFLHLHLLKSIILTLGPPYLVHIHSLHKKGHVYEDDFHLFILGDDHWDPGMNAFAKKVIKELGRKGILRENSYVKQLIARKNYYFYGATKQTKGKS